MPSSRILTLAAVCLAIVFLGACASEPTPGPPDVAYLRSQQTRELGLPFSDAVRVDSLLFLSGQVGNVPGTLDLAPGGMAAEARQAMANVRTILERHGSSLDRVVKCTVFLADMADWTAFNEVYKGFFRTDPPARSALGANGLALGARVEVECIATVGP